MKRSRSASSSSSARKRVAPLVLLALVLAAGGASAQDARVAEAPREGKVVWHTALALDSAQRLATRFEQTYGVKVEVHRSGSERILQRVMQELAAGIKNADVVNTSDTGHYVLLRRKNLLARYTPAAPNALPTAFAIPTATRGAGGRFRSSCPTTPGTSPAPTCRTPGKTCSNPNGRTVS